MQIIKNIFCFKYFAALAAVLLIAFSAAYAQNAAGVTFDVKIDGEPYLAEPFNMELTATVPAGKQLGLPDPETFKKSPFELLSVTAAAPVPVEGGAQYKYDFVLMPFDIGVSTFPALSWPLSDGSQTVNIESQVFNITIKTHQETKDLKFIDIRNIINPLPLLRLLLVLLMFAAAEYIAYRIAKKRDYSIKEDVVIDTRPSHVRAGDAINKLLESGIWEEGKTKEFYIRLTEIIRIYIKERFNLNAEKHTTLSLVRWFQKNNDYKEMAPLIRTLFNSADMVKFAKEIPEQIRRDRDVKLSLEFIGETAKPQEPVALPAETAAKKEAKK